MGYFLREPLPCSERFFATKRQPIDPVSLPVTLVMLPIFPGNEEFGNSCCLISVPQESLKIEGYPVGTVTSTQRNKPDYPVAYRRFATGEIVAGYPSTNDSNYIARHLPDSPQAR